jgi:hypothetical protein
MTQPLGSCPGCGGDEPFEQVHSGQHTDDQCPDADGECPEWVCSGCGAGVFMGAGVFTGTEAFTGTGVSTGASIGDTREGTPVLARQSVRAA